MRELKSAYILRAVISTSVEWKQENLLKLSLQERVGKRRHRKQTPGQHREGGGHSTNFLVTRLSIKKKSHILQKIRLKARLREKRCQRPEEKALQEMKNDLAERIAREVLGR